MAVDNGSIAEAARRLNLTAAGVAKRIHALESEIGAVLVTRSGRTIRPTEAGAAIVERARHFLADARDFKSIRNRPTAGQLHLRHFAHYADCCLTFGFDARDYPQIDVRITRGTAELYRKVLDGDDLDAAIVAQPHSRFQRDAIGDCCEKSH